MSAIVILDTGLSVPADSTFSGGIALRIGATRKASANLSWPSTGSEAAVIMTYRHCHSSGGKLAILEVETKDVALGRFCSLAEWSGYRQACFDLRPRRDLQ